jgi:hypothetical protein
MSVIRCQILPVHPQRPVRRNLQLNRQPSRVPVRNQVHLVSRVPHPSHRRRGRFHQVVRGRAVRPEDDQRGRYWNILASGLLNSRIGLKQTELKMYRARHPHRGGKHVTKFEDGRGTPPRRAPDAVPVRLPFQVRLDGEAIAMFPVRGGWAGTNSRGTRLIEITAAEPEHPEAAI